MKETIKFNNVFVVIDEENDIEILDNAVEYKDFKDCKFPIERNAMKWKQGIKLFVEESKVIVDLDPCGNDVMDGIIETERVILIDLETMEANRDYLA